ncbi:hypothetical protein [Leuconostoc citreum]|uniref:hypothetical protein n=1 Tax=Leuconostoc citreum TaxID=33964 RepID=UPI0015D9B473|nr:hypothetical protein [Leuconostoc citreum]
MIISDYALEIKQSGFSVYEHKTISQINQGVTPNEISKYQSAFRKIIEVKGHSAELDTVLTSFIDLDNVDADLKNKKLVIAFGDERFVYKTPDYIDYIKAYFHPTTEFPVEIALNYIRKYSSQSTLPLTRFIRTANGGFDQSLVRKLPDLAEKIKKRNQKFNSLKTIITGINTLARDAESILDNMLFKSPLEVFKDTKSKVNENNKIRYITVNIEKYSSNDLAIFTDYLIKNVLPKTLENTDFRKYFASYAFTLDSNTLELKI